MTTKPKSPSAKPKSRYRGDRRATTVVISEALVRAAQEYFPSTKHDSLSGFIENDLSAYFRKNAARVRSAGVTVPEAVFAK